MVRRVIGYARVSTDGQDESLQIEALEAAGCERIYIDRASGTIRERPELTNALRDLRDGEDVLVVWRLDRIGRSLRHLVDLVGDLRSRKMGFRSLNDPIDTTHPARDVRTPRRERGVGTSRGQLARDVKK